MSYLGLYHVPSSLVCYVYFMLCSIFLMFLSFVWTSFSHSSCTPYASLSLFISSFLSLLPLDSFVYSWQKGGEYIRKYTGVYCYFYMTHVHILRGRNFTSCTFIGGNYTSCKFYPLCIHPYVIVLYWLHVWTIIFIWLSCVWSNCSYVSHHVYLIAFYLLYYTCSFITWFTLRV